MTFEQKTPVTDDPSFPEMITSTDDEHKKLTPDIQHEFTNSDDLDIAVYCAFGGWRRHYKTEVEHHIGGDVKKTVEVWDVDYAARSMNESGCNYIANAIRPLISAVAITGSMDKTTLYNMWTGKTITMRYHLLQAARSGMKHCIAKTCRNIYYDSGLEHCPKCKQEKKYEIVKNPYDLNTDNIEDIMTTVLTFYAISCNAEGGFKLKQFSQSYMTTNIIKNGGLPEKNEGIIERIQKGFRT